MRGEEGTEYVVEGKKATDGDEGLARERAGDWVRQALVDMCGLGHEKRERSTDTDTTPQANTAPPVTYCTVLYITPHSGFSLLFSFLSTVCCLLVGRFRIFSAVGSSLLLCQSHLPG